MLLWGELFQQLFVWSVIGRGSGWNCLPEQVLFREKLPDLTTMLSRDTWTKETETDSMGLNGFGCAEPVQGSYKMFWYVTAGRGRSWQAQFKTFYYCTCTICKSKGDGRVILQHEEKMSCIWGIWFGHSEQRSSTVKILDISKVITLTIWQIDVGVGRNKTLKKMEVSKKMDKW